MWTSSRATAAGDLGGCGGQHHARHHLIGAQGGDGRARQVVNQLEPRGLDAALEHRRETAQAQPPCRGAEEDARHHRCHRVLAVDHAITHRRENGNERKDGHGVGEGQEQRARIRLEHIGALARQHGGGGFGTDDLVTDIGQEQPAENAQPRLPTDKRGDDGGDAQGADETVDRVGGCRTQPRGETGAPALAQAALDAQQANGADRSCDAKPDDHGFEEDEHENTSRIDS